MWRAALKLIFKRAWLVKRLKSPSLQGTRLFQIAWTWDLRTKYMLRRVWFYTLRILALLVGGVMEICVREGLQTRAFCLCSRCSISQNAAVVSFMWLTRGGCLCLVELPHISIQKEDKGYKCHKFDVWNLIHYSVVLYSGYYHKFDFFFYFRYSDDDYSYGDSLFLQLFIVKLFMLGL